MPNTIVKIWSTITIATIKSHVPWTGAMLLWVAKFLLKMNIALMVSDARSMSATPQPMLEPADVPPLNMQSFAMMDSPAQQILATYQLVANMISPIAHGGDLMMILRSASIA